jgi:photosystem II stability/assembly factor-like uncharacterized protein
MKNWTIFFVFFCVSNAILAQTNWQTLTPPIREWTQVAVASPTTMYAVNSLWGEVWADPILARSTDGGMTWDSVNSMYFYATGLEFWDADNGHILGGHPACGLYAGMLNVTNGGQTISERSYFTELSSMTTNLQTQSTYGEFYLTGHVNKVFLTTDTGTTLTPFFALPGSNDWTNQMILTDMDISGTSGVVCGVKQVYNETNSAFEYKGMIFHGDLTTGAWSVDSFSSSECLSIQRISNQNIYVLSETELIHSINSGQTWTVQPLPAKAVNFQVIDANRLFVLDSIGDVWESLNAGVNWVLSLSGQKIRDIQCAHNQCLVGGDAGAMFKMTYENETRILSGFGFTLTPNPTQYVLTFLSADPAIFDYQILDIAGKQLGNGKIEDKGTIDLSQLPMATYIINVTGLGAQQILVQH